MSVHVLVLLVVVSIHLDTLSAPVAPNACTGIFVATPPDINLVGPAEIVAPIGEPYEDPGATASSSFFGDLTSDIIVFGRVDAFKSGVYHVVYEVLDPCGNLAAPRARTVHVVEPGDELPAVRAKALFLLASLVVVVACARIRSMSRV